MKKMLSLILVLLMTVSLFSPTALASGGKATPIAVDGGENHTVILYSDGTVRAIGDNTYGQCDVQDWDDIVQISTSFNHTLGLHSDGTVVATGDNSSGQCDVSGWSEIRKVAAGEAHSIGLRWDGTVVAVGSNRDNQCKVSKWTNITDIAAGKVNSVGVTRNGEVIVRGAYTDQEGYHIPGFGNVREIYVGTGYFAGLRKDDTVVGYGHNTYPDGTGYLDNIDVNGWGNIASMAVGRCNAFLLTKQGRVEASGRDDFGQLGAVSTWRNVKAVGAGLNHVIAILEDGSLVAAGDRSYGKCDVSDGSNLPDGPVSLGSLPYSFKSGKLWTRSETPSSGFCHTKADAPGCWANTAVPGHTTAPVYDNCGNQYSFAMHLDGDDTREYRISFPLDGQYTRFSGVCAYPKLLINDEWSPVYKKYFQVFGDGRLLHTTSTTGIQSSPELFSVNVENVQTLTIVWPALDGPNEVATLFDPVLE